MDQQQGSRISGSMQVEGLLEQYPRATGLLLQHGVPCLVCGEPVWGTLHEVLTKHGKAPADIVAIIDDLRKVLEATEG